MSFETLIPLIVLALVALPGFRITRESERIVVFRLGRPNRLAGPGLVWMFYAVERGIRIDIAAIPDWRSLSEADLMTKAVECVAKPAGPSRDNAVSRESEMRGSPYEPFERLWMYATFAYFFVVMLIALYVYVYASGDRDWNMLPFFLLAVTPVFISFGALAIYTGETWGKGGHFYRSQNPILYWISVVVTFFFGFCLFLAGIIGLSR